MWLGIIIACFIAGAFLLHGEGIKGHATLVGSMAIIVLPIFYGASLFSAAYIKARTGNYYWRSSKLGTLTFHSTYEPLAFFGLYLLTIFGGLFTLGLAYPWLRIKFLKYRIGRTRIMGPANAFQYFEQAQLAGNEGATGDNLIDVWDIDLGF